MNEQLATIRNKAKIFNISPICAHAPTEEKDGAFKDAFYAVLKQTCERCPYHDVNIGLVDFNSKVERKSIFSPTEW